MRIFKLFFTGDETGAVCENDYIEMDVNFFTKHNPETGGYLVMYDDGYMSYSPAEPFEKGYSLLDS